MARKTDPTVGAKMAEDAGMKIDDIVTDWRCPKCGRFLLPSVTQCLACQLGEPKPTSGEPFPIVQPCQTRDCLDLRETGKERYLQARAWRIENVTKRTEQNHGRCDNPGGLFVSYSTEHEPPKMSPQEAWFLLESWQTIDDSAAYV